jgi:transposase
LPFSNFEFYHVILRGNGGQDIFFSKNDRTKLYLLLQEGMERFGHRIHAFCLSDMIRKSYTREFKIRAVQLMKESSKPIRKLADELGVSENNLYTWRKQLREKADNAFSNQPRFDEKELEIRRLKAQVSELEEEREILLVPFG